MIFKISVLTYIKTMIKELISKYAPLFIIILFAFLLRAAFVYFYPIIRGDGFLYIDIAQNIYKNFCVSISDVSSGECKPSWGEHQLPGYPFFIAITWIIDESLNSVRIFQCLIFSISICYISLSIKSYTKSKNLYLFIALILSISPLSIAWPRHIFTETLAISLTLWVFAEIIFSLKENKLRIWQIALPMIFSIFVRIDLITLCIPIAVAGFVIHTPLIAIRRGFFIALIVMLPLSMWSLRSFEKGIGFIPELTIFEKRTQGISDWARTWSTNQYHLILWEFPILKRKYSEINPPEYAYKNELEKNTILKLIEEASYYDDLELPYLIDNEFRKIAKQKKVTYPIEYWLVLPAKRFILMWANPYNSLGFPAYGELSVGYNSTTIKNTMSLGFVDLIQFAIKNPELTLYKTISFVYRIILIFSFFLILFLLIFKKNFIKYRPLIYISLSFIISRTLIFTLSNVYAARYILEAAVVLELIFIIGIIFPFIKEKLD